jgi:RimJ/RimL family protein N-acetyltransferase
VATPELAAPSATGARAILETPRLRLRELTLADIPHIAALFEDDAARRFYPDMHRAENAERWIRRNLETYQQDGFGLWAMVRKDNNAFAGDCGLMRQQIDGREEIEVGYHLHAGQRGLGFATEAAAACVHWGFDHLDCPRIVSMVHPENHASQAVCKRVHRQADRFWRHGALYYLFISERPRSGAE